eukprot:9177161-Alexandrium_andersonii.AAC.1
MTISTGIYDDHHHLSSRGRGLRPPDPPEKRLRRACRPTSSMDSASALNNGAEGTSGEFRRSMLRPFLGPRSSSFERLKQVLTFWDRTAPQQ